MIQHITQIANLTADQFGELVEKHSYNGTLRAIAEATPPTLPDLPEHPTRKQTAKYFGVSLVTLNKWSRDGKLQALTLNGRIRYRRADVVAAMQEVKNGKTKR